jgi:polyisoprenoid-binding protein YceI
MTKRIALLLGCLMLSSYSSRAQTSTWVPDKNHSGIDFSVLHLTVAKVRGHFGNISGTLNLNEVDVSKSTVQMTIDVSTVDTGVASRDADLKSPKFFDVVQFPIATFASTAVKKSEGGLTVTGNLTLHGVTKPVVLQVEGPTGPVPGMDKKPHSGFEATTTLSRAAFGIGPTYPNSVVSDEVKLTIDMDLAKQ